LAAVATAVVATAEGQRVAESRAAAPVAAARAEVQEVERAAAWAAA